MSQERETTEKLLQKDEALLSVQKAVKNIGSQVEQIAVNLADIATCQTQQAKTSAEETQSEYVSPNASFDRTK